jgi:hypothetical protein
VVPRAVAVLDEGPLHEVALPAVTQFPVPVTACDLCSSKLSPTVPRVLDLQP